MPIDRRRLEQWCQAGGPISPLAQALIAQALFALDEIERCKRLLAVQRAEKERTAEKHWREAREDETRSLVRLFNGDQEVALAHLKRTAEGVRYLVRRWTDISNGLSKEGTVYGPDRVEMIQMQGQSAVIEELYQSEVAWETYRDCIAAQPNPKPRDIAMICASDVVPRAIQDRREEEPALAAANALALAGLAREEGALLRALRGQEASFVRATTALDKLRGKTTGAPLGSPAALATPPVCACAEPVDPGAGAGGRPPRRRVPSRHPSPSPGRHSRFTGTKPPRRKSMAGQRVGMAIGAPTAQSRPSLREGRVVIESQDVPSRSDSRHWASPLTGTKPARRKSRTDRQKGRRLWT
jgi:hypothetical protein